MDNRNKFWKGVLVGALVTAFAGLIVVGMSAGIFLIGRSVMSRQPQRQTSRGESGAQLDWGKVSSKAQLIQAYIEKYFLFDEEEGNVEEYIYKGLMAGLDDAYSTYYTAEEFEDLMEETSGEYCGIGALVSKNMTTGLVSIVKVFRNTPAQEAGLQTGDVFYQIDDLEVTGDIDLDILVSQYVKGEEGTTVHLKMYRPSIEDYVEMDVERRQVEVQTVEYEMKADNLGYVSVSQFEDTTTAQFIEAIEDLESQGMEGLIIDLRGNPGGVLDTAVDMLDYMLPDDLTQYSDNGKTLLVSTADKNGEGDSYYCEDGHSVDVPVTILVDGNSASASEVFSGAMKDYGRAALVGTTTFGKGIVQTVFSLNDGSAIKLTTAHYYSPSGFDLHGIGIEPDVEIAYQIPEMAVEDGDDAETAGDGAAGDIGNADDPGDTAGDPGVSEGAAEEGGDGDETAGGIGADAAGGADDMAEAGVMDNQLEKAEDVLREMIDGRSIDDIREAASAEKAEADAALAADAAVSSGTEASSEAENVDGEAESAGNAGSAETAEGAEAEESADDADAGENAEDNAADADGEKETGDTEHERERVPDEAKKQEDLPAGKNAA